MPPDLITVEEYYDLPSRKDVIVELHLGGLVELPWPRPSHIKLQHRVAELLEACAGTDWAVLTNLPFRAVRQYDLRAVDVGVIAKSREKMIGDRDLFGAPEITVDILPITGPLHKRAALFLVTGTQQFCIIDEPKKLVRVTGPNSKTVAYSSGQEVPFPLLGASIAVDEIFA
jgi:hypothetical protein